MYNSLCVVCVCMSARAYVHACARARVCVSVCVYVRTCQTDREREAMVVVERT